MVFLIGQIEELSPYINSLPVVVQSSEFKMGQSSSKENKAEMKFMREQIEELKEMTKNNAMEETEKRAQDEKIAEEMKFMREQIEAITKNNAMEETEKRPQDEKIEEAGTVLDAVQAEEMRNKLEELEALKEEVKGLKEEAEASRKRLRTDEAIEELLEFKKKKKKRKVEEEKKAEAEIRRRNAQLAKRKRVHEDQDQKKRPTG